MTSQDEPTYTLSSMELLRAELLATVSHELRSPLTSIRGYTTTLLKHERHISREERRVFLTAINDASQRLEVLIDRLLEMSQLEMGTLEIKRSLVNLVYLVREAITALEQRLEVQLEQQVANKEKAYTLRFIYDDEQTAIDTSLVLADRRRLREALDHLLENAIIYSPQGGVIEVGIHSPSTHTQQMIELWIRDQGIGIPSEHLERVFERFHRVDTRLTREVNGLGLGLAISKHIVELHQGTIWVESDLGKGSTFHILLPTIETVKDEYNASKEGDNLNRR